MSLTNGLFVCVPLHVPVGKFVGIYFPSCQCYQLCWWWKGIHTLHVHTAGVGGGERDTHWTSKLQQMESGTNPARHRVLLMVIFLLCNVENQLNAGMPKKSKSGNGISWCSQLPQSSIGIPASESARHHWSRINPALPSYDHNIKPPTFYGVARIKIWLCRWSS